MNEVVLSRVTINIGVGEAGEKLDKACTLVGKLTGQKPIKTVSKTRNPSWKLRKGLLIGAKVTLRKKKADEFLKRALEAVDKKIKRSSFDKEGNFSFGIREYIDIPGAIYESAIGMFGLDVCVTLKKKGYRIKERKRATSKVPVKARVTPEQAAAFMQDKYRVVVE